MRAACRMRGTCASDRVLSPRAARFVAGEGGAPIESRARPPAPAGRIRRVSARRPRVRAAAGESAMDRKRAEGRGAGCGTPGVMMPHRLLALLGVLGACLATSGPAHAVTVTLPSAQDSWLGQDGPNTNHGADAHMHVRSEVGKVHRGIIQFNLSSIPACASIDSATLKISIENAGNSSRIYEVHRVAASWTESGVTWNRRNSTTFWTSAGGDFVAAPTDSVPTGTVNNVLLQWNVTPDVAAFVSGAATNAGWLVKVSVEHGTRKEVVLRKR